MNIVSMRTGKIMAVTENVDGAADALIAAGWSFDAVTYCWTKAVEREIGNGYKTTDHVNVSAEDVVVEVKMAYKDYKRDYADCKTKPSSYDAASKTIVVYVQ